MKNFQRNLFILIAVGLCGACAYQWYLQASQMDAMEHLNSVIYTNSTAIQGYTNSIRDMDAEINQLQERVAQLKRNSVSNDQWAVAEKREVARLLSAGDIVSNELGVYEAAVKTLTNRLDEAYTGEKTLAAQRDDFVRRLNQSIQQQNELTVKYNSLVERINKLQSTNAAPAPR
jgi:chromosome segregation ATPase